MEEVFALTTDILQVAPLSRNSGIQEANLKEHVLVIILISDPSGRVFYGVGLQSLIFWGIAGSNAAGGHGSLSLLNFVCFQLVKGAVAECNRETLILWGPWPNGGPCPMGS
jgi:hypothetical protein